MAEEKKRKSEVQVIPASTVEEGYVTLPYGKEEFRSFIKSLLGSPQSISKTFRGSFDFDFNDIRNLYSLLFQRVSQQNEGVLASFNAKIAFSDNSAVEINSVEELLTYNEVKPITSKAIYLTWDFVVRFQDKDSPEKQRIQIAVISSGENIPTFDEHFASLRYFALVQGGIINFRIEHTARTWGADIEALLTNHIKSLLREPNPIKEFIRKNSSGLSIALFIILIVVTLLSGFFATQQFANLRTEELTSIIQNVSISGENLINHKLDYIALMAANGHWVRFAYSLLTFFVVMLAVALGLSIWFEKAADTFDPSFVLLTKEAHKDREKAYKKLQRQWITFIFVNIIAILTGIISNFIFTWLINL